MNKINILLGIPFIFLNQTLFTMEGTGGCDAREYIPQFSLEAIREQWRGHEHGAQNSLKEARQQPGILEYSINERLLGIFDSTNEQETVVTFINKGGCRLSFEEFEKLININDHGEVKNNEGNETDADPLIESISHNVVPDESKKCCCCCMLH